MEDFINSINTLDQLKQTKILLKTKKKELECIKNKNIVDEISKEKYYKNDIDSELWNIIGGNKRLIEKKFGRYWVVEFDNDNIVCKLHMGSTKVFIRTDSRLIGGTFPDIISQPMARFYCFDENSKIENSKIEIILIYHVYTQRSDSVVMSGLRGYNINMKGEDIISWKTEMTK
jgi:hypothetical protein